MNRRCRRASLVLVCVAAGSLACLCLPSGIVPLTGESSTATPEGAQATAPRATAASPPLATETEEPLSPTSPPLATLVLPGTPTPTSTRRPTRVPSATPTATLTLMPTPDAHPPEIIVLGANPNPAKVGAHSTVTAKIRDPSGVKYAYVLWGYSDEGHSTGVFMDEVEPGVYEVDIPGSAEGFPRAGTVLWEVWACDNKPIPSWDKSETFTLIVEKP
jgi:hypothetical protein